MKKIVTFMTIYMISIIGVITNSCLFNTGHSNYYNIEDVGEWMPLTDSSHIDYYYNYKHKIYGTDLESPNWNDLFLIDPLEGIDYEDVQVCKGSGYAKDKHHVIYPLVKISIDFDEHLPGSMTNFGILFEKYIIEGADPGTFKYIGDGYGIDNRHMYYNGEEIKWDDNIIKQQIEKYQNWK